jgi:iron complex transport system substrate-binding protein
MRLLAGFTRAAAAVVACLALTSCTAASGQGGDASQSAAAESGDTRVVTDVEGTEVTVPTHPQRVVTLSEPTLDGVFALGVTPIGTVSGRGQSTVPNYLADLAGDIPILGTVAQPNYEAIGAADPDLILVDGTSVNNNPPVIAALREIAPVVYTGYAGGDWRANFTFVADALNMQEQGQEVMDAYDAKVTAAKAKLTAYADDTFSIVRWQGGGASLILKELPPGQALTDLGLKRPEDQDTLGRGHSEPVALENLQEIDADYIFFGTLGGSSVDNPTAGGDADTDAATQALSEAEAVPGFTQLNAYKTGHIIPVDGSAWTSTGGPLLMERLVDDVVKALG